MRMCTLAVWAPRTHSCVSESVCPGSVDVLVPVRSGGRSSSQRANNVRGNGAWRGLSLEHNPPVGFGGGGGGGVQEQH